MQGHELIYEGSDSPKGKTWRIRLLTDGQGLRIEHGAVGSRLRSVHVPRDMCSRSDMAVEMERRVRDKTDKGYVIVRSDLDPVSKSGGLENTRDNDDQRRAPVVANVAISRYVSNPKERIDNYLETVLEPMCRPGTYSVVYEKPDYIITAQFPTAPSVMTVQITTSIGLVIRYAESALGLVCASMAQALPDLVFLSDDDGKEVTPFDLAERVESDPEVREQFGLSRAVTLGQTPALGAWFF